MSLAPLGPAKCNSERVCDWYAQLGETITQEAILREQAQLMDKYIASWYADFEMGEAMELNKGEE
jgi:hypothetical protein